MDNKILKMSNNRIRIKHYDITLQFWQMFLMWNTFTFEVTHWVYQRVIAREAWGNIAMLWKHELKWSPIHVNEDLSAVLSIYKALIMQNEVQNEASCRIKAAKFPQSV